MPSTTHTSLAADALRGAVRGTVIGPDDASWSDTTSIFYSYTGATPRLVVRPCDAADVAAAIGVARDLGLEVAVRSGGHSVAGHSSVADGLVIDLRDLDSLEIDPDALLATVGAGVTAGRYTTEAGKHSLATGFGDTGSVGIGGITTGGGVGFLSRKHGLTVDNLVAAQVVTADGSVHDVDDGHEPDLFWAIRGGGGNVGIVTRFTFRLHEVRQIVGGMLLLPATAETVAEFMRLAVEAPDDLGAIAAVMPAPPMPFIPQEARGQVIILAQLAYAGPAEDADEVLAPFRKIATPIADLLAPMPYAGLFPPDEAGFRPIATSVTGFASGIDTDLAQTVLDSLCAATSRPGLQMAAVQLRPLGGAIARVPADATAYAHREQPIMFNVAAMVGDVADLDAQHDWVTELASTIADGTLGAYVGFSIADDPEQVRAIYPGATYDRLAAVKRTYDPDNVFHRNHNVPPATG
ncbi:FAD-binding oxidoreductase [Monashia sp. NPDC004114]